MAAFIASLTIACVSVVGILFFRNTHNGSQGAALFLPLSIGAFLGITFFELLPEAFHATPYASYALTAGFLGFFLLSRALHEYHHHHHIGDAHIHHDAHTHARGMLVLVGDAVHNFADGIVIAIAFSVSFKLGMATTLAIALHEIPQEIAELFILIHAGYTKKRALLLNFLSALTVVVGTVLTTFAIKYITLSVGILLGIAAGNLLYIAASDLLPTLSDRTITRNMFMRQSALVLLGLVVIATLLTYTHESEEPDAHESLAAHLVHHT